MEIPKHVIFDHLSGDPVVINLHTGAYYMLTDEGSKAMQAAEAKSTGCAGAAGHKLIEEGLIVGNMDCAVNHTPSAQIPFEKFEDLQSLLAADPVHDVDEYGWPKLQ